MDLLKSLLALYALHSSLTSAFALFPQQPLTIPHLPPPSNPPSPITTSHPPNLPVVIWHGLGDNYQSEGLTSIATLLNRTLGPTYTYPIRLDPSPSADRTASYFGNLTEAIATVCADLATHPILSTAPAINALGFSQGGQFMRAYVQRCNRPPVANLITFGAQHNGISEFQDCGDGDWLCRTWEGVLKGNTWSDYAQSRLVPAQYYRDPDDLENYLQHSNFLADVNNEREVKNGSYREKMMGLERFVMYMFEEDTVVVPKESAFFSEVNRTSGAVTGVRERELYEEDWIGLRGLDEGGKLVFDTLPGGHMQLTSELLVDIFLKYFKRR